MYVCVYVCVYIYIYIYIYIHKYVYIYIYIHMYTHTHTSVVTYNIPNAFICPVVLSTQYTYVAMCNDEAATRMCLRPCSHSTALMSCRAVLPSFDSPRIPASNVLWLTSYIDKYIMFVQQFAAHQLEKYKARLLQIIVI